MKIIKVLTLILLLLGAILFGTLAYNGAFQKVEIEKGTQGGYWIMGFDHKGSYQEIGPTFNKVRKMVDAEKIDSNLFVGIYFDDPGKVEESKLRSIAGMIIKDTAYLSRLKPDYPKLRIFSVPKSYSYFTELETKGMISMIIAAVKAYPALGESITKDKAAPNGQGLAFEEYHSGFTRFVMQVE
jgi:hypothetical protein